MRTSEGVCARLRHTKATGLWAIDWRDRKLKFHEYEHKRSTKNVQALLDRIDASGDPIFWVSKRLVDCRYSGG